MRAKFAEIKLNHVNMRGAKMVAIKAFQLSNDPNYINQANEDEKKKMKETVFEEAWALSLKNFHSDVQKKEILQIYLRNTTKLFRGRVDILPDINLQVFQ
jgi:hypothetical protein